MDFNPETENTDDGAFVTRAELKVLFALWNDFFSADPGTAGHRRVAFAEKNDLPLSLVERVEALLFAEGA